MSCNHGSPKKRPEKVVDIRTIEVFSEQKIQSTSCVCLPDSCPMAKHQLRTLCKLMSDILNKLDMHCF